MIPWERAWQLTPVFLPGESHGQRNLAGYSPKGCKDSNMTKQLSSHISLYAPGTPSWGRARSTQRRMITWGIPPPFHIHTLQSSQWSSLQRSLGNIAIGYGMKGNSPVCKWVWNLGLELTSLRRQRHSRTFWDLSGAQDGDKSQEVPYTVPNMSSCFPLASSSTQEGATAFPTIMSALPLKEGASWFSGFRTESDEWGFCFLPAEFLHSTVPPERGPVSTMLLFLWELEVLGGCVGTRTSV